MNILRTILFALSFTATAAGGKPTTEDKDWEQACGGSNIRVTKVAAKIVLIDAIAEHFAEGRQWVCHLKDGKIVSAMYRHFIVTRKGVGDAGQFTTVLNDDRIEVFHFPDHEVRGLPCALEGDLKEVLSIATSKGKAMNANRSSSSQPPAKTTQ